MSMNILSQLLRPLPYPYRAMLALCSDLDETPDCHVYWEIARFLNTDLPTTLGMGVGLEVGNSIYFDMPPGQLTYWNTDDAGREMLRALMRSGHIDCLHSYGDLACTRRQAQAALDELAGHGCRLQVWVDHAVAPTNFGSDIMHGHGDEPEHEAYHADLTLAYGIRYVSRGRVTSVLGQDTRPRLMDILRAGQPILSGRTMVKEQAKRALGRLGCRKYAMHAGNNVLRPIRLRDGSPCYEFLRCNPCRQGVGACASGRRIGQVLTAEMIDRLCRWGGLCVLYTHLGKIHPRGNPFDPAAIAAFGRLREAQQAGRILTTTTRRLLGYARAMRELVVQSRAENGAERIDIGWSAVGASGLAESDLAGLTFYTQGDRAVVRIGGREIKDVVRNGPDETGRASVSIPWQSLEFPQL